MRNGPYELVVAPGNYPGRKYRGRYVYEHHLVWWMNTGQLVPEGHVVHHKNEIKRDNSFDNLELKSKGDHTAEHNEDRSDPPIKLVCAWCKQPFTMKMRTYKLKAKRGQRTFCCSRSCQVRKQQHDRRTRS